MFNGKKRLQGFIAGIVSGAILFTGIGVHAAGGTEITAYFTDLKYFFDGSEKKPSEDKQGFIYKGTTYVPLRFISESLGEEVGWEGTTKTIHVGEQPEGEVTYMGNMDKHTSSDGGYWDWLGGDNVQSFTTNTGEEFLHGYYLKRTGNHSHPHAYVIREYFLNGQYSKFSALLAPGSFWNSYSVQSDIGMLKIYGDGELLYNSGPIASDITQPVKVDVDLTGVLRVQVEAKGKYFGLLDPKFIR